MRSESTQSFSIIVILTVSVVSLFAMTLLYHGGSDPGATKFAAFAQLTNDNIIQIVSTSTHTDDFGNFHIIGEVNNTSPDPQTNILITALMSDTNNNVLVGNYSAFSSISTLRQGELSPFDIVIQDPQQILGKFNFMEFSTTSQPAIEKPTNLLLNGTSVFLDNTGNPHITGNIVNQGPSPEQFLNLVATFYDNSSLGVIGTQSFGLSLGNLSQNQGVPFDVTISDNKTKSQGMFYSLNMDSPQSSMAFPTNTKFFLYNDGSGGGIAGTGFADSGGSIFTTPPPISGNQGFVNGDNNNVQSSSPSGPDNDNSAPSPSPSPSSSPTAELDIEIDVEDDPLVRGNIQTIDVIVSDENTQEKIANATTDLRVFYNTDFDKSESGLTNNDGLATFEIEIGPASTPGNFDVTATVKAAGYNTETDRTTFEVIEEPDNINETNSQNNTTNTNSNNEPDTNNSEEGTNQNEDAEIETSSDQEQQQQSEEEDQNDAGNGNNEGNPTEDNSGDDNNNGDDDGSNN
jgi:hypothetical protein